MVSPVVFGILGTIILIIIIFGVSVELPISDADREGFQDGLIGQKKNSYRIRFLVKAYDQGYKRGKETREMLLSDGE